MTNGIAAIEGTGVVDFATAVSSLESASAVLESVAPDEIEFILSTVKGVEIVPASGSNSTVLGNKITIREDQSDGEMLGVLYTLAIGE